MELTHKMTVKDRETALLTKPKNGKNCLVVGDMKGYVLVIELSDGNKVLVTLGEKYETIRDSYTCWEEDFTIRE